MPTELPHITKVYYQYAIPHQRYSSNDNISTKVIAAYGTTLPMCQPSRVYHANIEWDSRMGDRCRCRRSVRSSLTHHACFLYSLRRGAIRNPFGKTIGQTTSYGHSALGHGASISVSKYLCRCDARSLVITRGKLA